MSDLQIGEIINKLRKNKGLTQEQLANFIGVSTAAVSKWESKCSYPDITLLPKLATFFNVTIDELLNFKIELSEEDIKKIYEECETLFNNKNSFVLAFEKSKEYILKYPNSYKLKSKISHLYFTYSWKLNDEEKVKDMIRESIELLEDIVTNSNDIELVETSLFALGSLYSSVEEEEKAIECLNKIRKSYCDPNDILASIYIKQNKLNEARKILQGKLSKCIFDISIICISLANAYKNCEDELEIKEKYYKLSLDIKKCISPYGDAILSSILEYFGLVRLYLKHNDIEKALESLQTLVDNFEKSDINSIENKSNLWCFRELKLSDENSIKMNLYENIFCMLDDKMFDRIRDTIEFRDLIEKLNGLEEKSLGKRKEII